MMNLSSKISIGMLCTVVLQCVALSQEVDRFTGSQLANASNTTICDTWREPHYEQGTTTELGYEIDPPMPPSKPKGSNQKEIPHDGWLYTSQHAPPEVGVRFKDIFPIRGGDASLEGVPPVSDIRRNHGLIITVAYDAWMHHADAGWNNNGIRVGGNFGTKLGEFSELTGFGAQCAASIGVYGWPGTDYRLKNQEDSTSQGFFTYGLFRRADKDSRWSVGLVQDWVANDNYGTLAEDPTMSQLRGQIGYAIDSSNEFGFWGACRVVEDSKNVDTVGNVRWRPINQLSYFWHHKWEAYGPETWISFGVPEADRLVGEGSLGDYVVSASALCPLNDVAAVDASVSYMHPSGHAGPATAVEDTWNYVVAISIYRGRNARSSTVAGDRWMPLMPLANNGNFLVDVSSIKTKRTRRAQ